MDVTTIDEETACKVAIPAVISVVRDEYNLN
jgi:hypothetical protein